MKPYVLAFKSSEDLVSEFKKIGVDWGGVGIMAPKGISRIVKVSPIRSFSANILKQEMLSLGGDVALSRDSITGKAKKTACLIIGNSSQISHLIEKLKHQPFGLDLIGQEVKVALKNFEEKRSVLDLSGKKIRLGNHTLVMGIINATPDSFSGDGIVALDPQEACEFALTMVRDGADILDIGGESSRPGSRRISAKEEIRRVLPIFKKISKKIRVPLSIDTTKSEVAHAALDAGASIVNDISALRSDRKMARLAARYKAAVVLMHMKGTPATMQKAPCYDDVMHEIMSFLQERMDRALDAGIPRERIIVDPGIGFGKELGHNLEILRRLSDLKSLGRPVLIGLSRKRFIGSILDADIRNRAWGTAAALGLAIAGGANIVRVHDVREMKQVVKLTDTVVYSLKGRS
jgi:dihydropteroate synthase